MTTGIKIEGKKFAQIKIIQPQPLVLLVPEKKFNLVHENETVTNIADLEFWFKK